MLDKKFVIAISKSDMLDEELKEAIEKELPGRYTPYFYFVNSTAGTCSVKRSIMECPQLTRLLFM